MGKYGEIGSRSRDGMLSNASINEEFIRRVRHARVSRIAIRSRKIRSFQPVNVTSVT